MSPPPDPTPPAPVPSGGVPWDAFVELVELVRADGAPIGVETHETVRTLVLRLTAAGAAPADAAGWRTFLGPVLSGTPERQRRFDTLFAAWLARHAPPEPRPVPGPVDVAPKRVWLFGGAAISVAGALTFASIRSGPQEPRTPVADAKPVAGNGGAGAPDPAPVPGMDAAPAPAAPVAPAFVPEVLPDVIGAEPDGGADARPGWSSSLVAALAFGVAAALGAIWLLFRRQFLARGRARDAALAEVWTVPVPTPPLFRPGEVSAWARPLRTRVALGTTSLDVPATIDATIASGGWWSPVERDDLASVDYVVLVDRRSRRDVGARWALEAVEALRDAQVSLEVYEFDGDPGRVTALADGASRTLDDLRGRHDRSRLWVVSGAEAAFDRTTGALTPSWASLARFADRTLVTPRPVAAWGGREGALERTGLRLVPATWTTTGARARGPEADVEAPARCRDTRRLSNLDAPDAAFAEGLVGDLRRHLGEEGFLWLVACAVYPEIRWELVLYLGGALRDAGGAPLFDRGRLARLSRLVWFRDGRMPDWVRRRLLDGLAPADERRVRGALDAVLAHARAAKRPSAGMTLEILDPRTRRLTGAGGGGASRTAPMRDVLYRRTMDDRLAVRIPRRLRRHPRLVRAAAALLLVGLPAGAVAAHAAWRERDLEARDRAALAADAVEFLRGFAEPVGLGSGAAIDPDTGYPKRIRRGKDGAEMVLIPAGSFLRGAVPQDPFAEADERPRRWVTVTRPYYLDVVEVTNGRFDAVTPTSPQSPGAVTPSGPADLPKAGVSHTEAEAYATAVGCELPTEAQFERALRAGRHGTIYPWGDDERPPKGAGNLPDESRFRATQMATIVPDYDDGFSELAPVGSFPANAYGLHDLVGNVREWCREPYDAKAYETASATDPEGPSPLFTAPDSRARASARGGSYTYQAMRIAVEAVTCSARTPTEVEGALDVGFRCVRSIPPVERGAADPIPAIEARTSSATGTALVLGVAKATLPAGAALRANGRPMTAGTLPDTPPNRLTGRALGHWTFLAASPTLGRPTFVLEAVLRGRVLGAATVLVDPVRFGEDVRRFLAGFADVVGDERDPATGFPKRIRRVKDDGEMVLIPAGTFQMGAVPGDSKASSPEKPRHAATLSKAYYLDVNEVTVAQWKKYVSDGGGRAISDFRSEATDRHPVHRVDHPEATSYARWAGAALPTEAQWERAAKGGHDDFVYPWGVSDDKKRRNGLGSDDGFDGLAPARSYGANDYGVFDLAGNVREWCSDWYDGSYYGNSPGRDPAGPGSGSERVARGGSFLGLEGFDVGDLRASFRINFVPSTRNVTLGFRLARSLDAAAEPPVVDTTSQVSAEVEAYLRGFAVAVGTEVDATTGYPKRIRRLKDDGEMVLIPAGTFQMGAVPGDAEAASDEKPRHAVTLSKAYYLDVNEVTVGQWKKYVSDGGGRAISDFRSEATDRHPVHNVDHTEATAFARWAGASLPTEAQWERGAKGGDDDFVYPWGTSDDPKRRNGSGSDDGFDGLAPVRSDGANEFGLFDLAGNVCEWCADWYDGSYYGNSPGRDPAGPGAGSARMVRGGSFNDNGSFLRASDRSNGAPTARAVNLGFRLARSLDAAMEPPAGHPTSRVSVEVEAYLRGFAVAVGTEVDATTGYPKRIRRLKDDGEMVLIPAGTYQMGAVPGDSKASSDEQPRHAVTLSRAYYLDVNEVTVGQWKKYVSDGGGRAISDFHSEATDRHPVHNVDHTEATSYARWAGAALPTEAQWERAAKGGHDEFVYPWGAADDEKRRNGSGSADGFDGLAPVRSFGANDYGIFDLSGNVSEWCADWYDSSYYGPSPGRDPTGPGSGSARVVRGGSFGNFGGGLRASDRGRFVPAGRFDGLGFRLARSL